MSATALTETRLAAREREIGRICQEPDCDVCQSFLADALALSSARFPLIPHGTNGYNNYGCRCTYCRVLHRLVTQRRRAGLDARDGAAT